MDLRSLPAIFIFPAGLSSDELHEAEDAIYEHNGKLLYEASEARIFLGRSTKSKRAAFELRNRGIWTEDVSVSNPDAGTKRRKLDNPTTRKDRGRDDSSQPSLEDLSDHVIVLKLEWLYKGLKAESLLPHEPFTIYIGRIVAKPEPMSSDQTAMGNSVTYIKATAETHDEGNEASTEAKNADIGNILDRTNAAAARAPFRPRRFKDSSGRDNVSGIEALLKSPTQKHPRLVRDTTSMLDNVPSRNLPDPPTWLTASDGRSAYACHRSTYTDPVNKSFLEQLYKIKEARLLTLDEIGVRAYSTAIASIAAYPHKLSEPDEILRLPGCSDKIAMLWLEWVDSYNPEHTYQTPSSQPSDETVKAASPRETNATIEAKRTIKVVEDLEANEDLKHLKLFWNIWGIGADTARKFYYTHGWQDLDDVVEFGWHSGVLSRVQQIGVKFYDEFQVKIPRKEVENIADVILKHARLCRGIPRSWWSRTGHGEYGCGGNWAKEDDGKGDNSWNDKDMACVIVGGYRRGKRECGDVDVILSHKDEEMTKDLVVDVMRSLEEKGWITHTLTLHTTGTDREQSTLPYRSGHAAHGFDSLDKALCVWQDPDYDKDKHEKNPNIHRRVDIIVSPWRTIGAAVLGWSGATTFERDIRRWVRKEHNWKFDSSGVRDRGSGKVLDLEKPTLADRSDSWQDRERRMMVNLGIGWRPGKERCTG